MKSYFPVIALFLLVCTTSYAQVTAPMSLPIVREGHYEFVKKVADEGYGLSMEIAGEPSKVEENLVRSMKEGSGSKPKGLKKDVYVLESAVIPAISTNRLDYYYRIEDAGSKEAPRSRVTFFISLGNYNFITPNSYPQELEAARRWLARIPVEARILELGGLESLRLDALEEVSDEKEGLEGKMSKIGEEKQQLEEEMAKLQAELDAVNTEYEQYLQSIEEKAALQKQTEDELQQIRNEITRLKGL